MPKPSRMFQFTGTHDRLITGEYYSINMLAIILDISDATLRRRL